MKLQQVVHGALAAILVFVVGYFAVGRGGSASADASMQAGGLVLVNPSAGGTKVATPPQNGQDVAAGVKQISYLAADPSKGQGVLRTPAGDGLSQIQYQIRIENQQPNQPNPR